MPIYVKDGGTWREISSNAGSQLYVRDATSFTNKTIVNAYIKDGGSWRTAFTLFDTPGNFTIAGSGTTNFSVPANANAIHIQQAVSGGGGGYTGTSYDKAGGESSGPGGGSGAYISDRVYTVVGGETLTSVVGTGGSAGTGAYSGTAGGGTTTSLTGSSTNAIFSLAGGGASSVSGGGVQGPLRSNTAGTGGVATAGTSLSSGTTVDGINITTFTSGPTNTFNSSGNGVTGGNNGNCGGDNCQINGSDGADSYNGLTGTGGDGGRVNVPATAGTQGGGGAGGGAENYGSGTAGSAGGDGEIKYRFIRIA